MEFSVGFLPETRKVSGSDSRDPRRKHHDIQTIESRSRSARKFHAARGAEKGRPRRAADEGAA